MLLEHSRFSVSGKRTDGGGLDHVADGESLDGLVLGRASRAVGAPDRLHVASAVLVTSAVNTISSARLSISKLFPVHPYSPQPMDMCVELPYLDARFLTIFAVDEL